MDEARAARIELTRLERGVARLDTDRIALLRAGKDQRVAAVAAEPAA